MSKMILAGQEFEVAALPYGKLRKVLPTLNEITNAFRANAGFTEDVMVKFGGMIALVLDKTTDEVDAMPIAMLEIINATKVIGDACGMVQKQSGEVVVVENSTGTGITQS
jgi:hypothetical protein